jgi:uncharacterized protein (DUF2267 family)
MSHPVAADQLIVASSDEAVERIVKALGLGSNVKSLSIDMEGGEAVKIYCTKYVSKEEIDKIANIVEEEFQNGLIEIDAEYYINGRPVAKNQQEPTENW